MTLKSHMPIGNAPIDPTTRLRNEGEQMTGSARLA